MVNTTTAWIFGASQAPYHPLEPVAALVQEILGDTFVLVTKTRSRDLHDIEASSPGLLILYDDSWTGPLDDKALDAVKSWLLRGGKVLAIHNGICWARRHDWFRLLGGRFTGHGAPELLTFDKPGKVGHFQLEEEPYRFVHPLWSGIQVLGTYQDSAGTWPAWWWKPCRKGRLVYAMAGHDEKSFNQEDCRAWLRQALSILG